MSASLKTTDTEIREFGVAIKTLACRECGRKCKRHSRRIRRINEVGFSRPIILAVRVGVYHCEACNKFFTNDLTYLAPERGKYTHRVIKIALHHMKNNSAETTRQFLREFSFVDVPVSTLYEMMWHKEMSKLGSFKTQDIPKIRALGREVLDMISDNFEFDYDTGKKDASISGIRLLVGM